MHVDTDDLATLLKMQHLDLEAMRDKKKLEELPQRAVILEARSKKKAIEQKRAQLDALHAKADAQLSRIDDEDRSEGREFDTAEHYEDYKQKLNRYINEHSNDEVIRKLHYNEPLSGKDFSNLENIMIHELGSREEYQKAFGDVPLGLSVRRIIKLDHQATMKAFGGFINNHSLSPAQNALMNRIIDYVEQNGYVQPEDLARPPFDRPKPLFLVFGKELMDLKVCIERLNANAMAPIA